MGITDRNKPLSFEEMSNEQEKEDVKTEVDESTEITQDKTEEPTTDKPSE